MAKNRDLEFLYEIGALRFATRAWKQFLGPSFANIVEHHYRVIWLALLLSKMEGRGDPYKIMKMALVHDLTESRTGDVHYVSKHYTQRDEGKAIKDILRSTSLEKEFMESWHEYEARKTIEAKIVKDADWLDIDLELREQKSAGRSDLKAWDKNRKAVAKLLFTRSARKLWNGIQRSSPMSWSLGPINDFILNRLTPEVKKHKANSK